MIVRIMGEGQFEVADDQMDALNDLDQKLVEAIEQGDEGAFAAALGDLLAAVRGSATPVPDDYLGPSEYVLPAPDATLEEVRGLLSEEGLLPG